MTGKGGSSRRYSDQEVRELLKRAADLESEGKALPSPSRGPTLEELEEIAAEAGINPLALRQAAQELQGRGRAAVAAQPGTSARILGGSLSTELEWTVQGEASPETLESLIPFIQGAADLPGQSSLLGRTLSWNSNNPQASRSLTVTVSVGRGSTRISVEERYGNLAGGLFGGIIGGVGGGVGLGVGLPVGLGALGSAFFAAVFPVAAIGGSFLLSRRIFGAFVRKRRDTLERLLDDLAAVVEDGVEEEEG